MKTEQGQSIEVALGAAGAGASLGTSRVHVYSIKGAANTSSPRPLASAVPQMITEDELLVWTPEWRSLVLEAREEVARGEALEFTNFRDLARWLSTEDD